jgi:CubicO group peptidase (beta-lactamase class C family)
MAVVRRRLPLLALLAALAAVAVAVAATARRVTFHAPASTAALGRELDAAIPRALAEHRVPGAAVAVVRRGRVAWSRGYGFADPRSRRPVTPRTRFQAASLSKPVSALGIVRLARERGVALTAPIVDDLRAWRPPPSRFDPRGITLARLLSHTAGLSVPGYLGLEPRRPLPPLPASLAGRSGDRPPVRLTQPPGRRFAYSGGGYSVAQLWAQETAGTPFAALMRAAVLAPLEMRRSSFEQADRPDDATPHDAQGGPIPAYRYPELAAAGLRATAPDLARFAAALMPGPRGEGAGRGIVPPEVLARMTSPAPGTDGRYGLGFELDRLADGTRVLEHEGSSRGWRGRLVAFPDRGWAIVVLTNGDGGAAVADAAVERLAR